MRRLALALIPLLLTGLAACETPPCQEGATQTPTFCQLDNLPPVECQGRISYPNLPIGTHTATVMAVNLACINGEWHHSDIGQDTRTWTVTPP